MKNILIITLLLISSITSFAQNGKLYIDNLTNCDASIEVYARDTVYGANVCGEYEGNQFVLPACTSVTYTTLCDYVTTVGWATSPGALPCPMISSTFQWTHIKVRLFNCSTICPGTYSDTPDAIVVCSPLAPCTSLGCAFGWSCCGAPSVSSSYSGFTLPLDIVSLIF